MADIDLKTETPDTTLPTTGFLFGADSQAAASPSVFTVQSVATTLLGSTTLTGATITTSQPVIDAAQTWNAGGVTFTGLKFNATDTASAATSLLMDLGTGGGSYASKFRVTKAGEVAIATAGYLGDSGGALFRMSSTGVIVGNSGTAIFGLANNNIQVPDVILSRRAAANLRLGAADAAAPVAQTLSVQSVVAGTTNTAGANLTITGSQGTGTGAGGSIIFQVAPAGSTGTAQNALAAALALTSNRSIVLPTGGALAFSVTTDGTVGANGITFFYDGVTLDSGVLQVRRTGQTTDLYGFGYSGINLGTARLGFGTGTGTSSQDTILTRDTSNTLALRNANNGQTFRIYGRFTDITNNFERFFINAPTTSGDAVLLGTQKGATTGAARALEFQTDGTTRLTIAATTGNVTTTGSVTTAAPTGGTAAAWRLGTVATVTATLPNRTIEVDIGGTIYYLHAKTTND